MHSAPGFTMGRKWGSSGSAIRATSAPISMKVHKTPPLSPDHCHGRPKQLQSIVSMCIQGVFNTRIIGKLCHKSPVGAVAMCAVNAHPGTPPHAWIICSACQCLLREPLLCSLRLLRNNVHQKYFRDGCYSAYTVFTLLNGMSVSLVCDKQLLKGTKHSQRPNFSHGLLVHGVVE